MDERTVRFRRLFDACFRPLHAYARRRCDPADVDDLVAEVLTVAWRRLDDVPADCPLPWLYGVAHRTLANQRRGARRRDRLVARLELERSVVAGCSSHTRTGTGADVDPDGALVAALARLRPDDREILRLTAWEQLSTAGVALVLGCTPNAAALRLSRARRRLRDELTRSGATRTGATGRDDDA